MVARFARLAVLHVHTTEQRIAVAEAAAGTLGIERALVRATSLGRVVAAARGILECARITFACALAPEVPANLDGGAS